jgi:hypothetical protein
LFQSATARFRNHEIIEVGLPAGSAAGVVVEQSIADALKRLELERQLQLTTHRLKPMAVEAVP